MAVDQAEILSERQVARWLGLSEPTLFRHRRDGTGPTFIRLSARRVGYRRSAVEVWLSQRERTLISDAKDQIRLSGELAQREAQRGARCEAVTR
jgi:predicted DNA-binding transcriptional regulator AlpA